MFNLAIEFPQDNELIYLNHAAVSPWPRRTSDAVTDFAEENCISGAKNYPKWQQKEDELRQQLQKLIKADSIDEIALQKNTSEALSVIAEGLKWQAGDNIVSSDEEFPSNRIPWQAQEKHGVELRQVNLRSSESPEQALMDACDNNTRLLSISSVQYGTGLKMDLAKLGEFCHSHDILFCVDAIQSLGAHRIDVEAARIDFMMADAHKWLMGPEGIALFYCRKERQNLLELRQFGWHMIENIGNYDEKSWSVANNARRFECGSPNMIGIHAMSTSLSLILDYGLENIENDIRKRTDILLNELKSRGYRILSPEQKERRAGIVTFKIARQDMQLLQQKLMTENVICAYRGGGIRLSPHFYTPLEKIKNSLLILDEII